MWAKNAMEGGLMPWTDAIFACNSSTVGNHNDWRLPNVEELRSLIHYGFRNPALPDTNGTGQGSECDPFCGSSNFIWFWSSTTDALANKYAWMVALHNCELTIRDKVDYISVLPVRDAK